MHQPTTVRTFLALCGLSVAVSAPSTYAQDDAASQATSKSTSQPSAAKTKALDVSAALAEGCEVLLEMQENLYSDDDAAPPREWPYEGVYRVRSSQHKGPVIPIGYRVGGTSIASLAMIEAPGYREDAKRVAAVERAVEFVLEGLDAPLMASGFKGSYDVRGWGHNYALTMFLRMVELEAVPPKFAKAVTAKVQWLIETLEATAIPKVGGWNYSRRHGFRDERNAPSPFMTAPTVQALLHAAASGHSVDSEIVEASLVSLQRGRTGAGGMTYTIPSKSKIDTDEGELSMMDKMEGSIARLPAVEATLWIAGRGDQERLCAAIEKFFVHWDALEVRKQKNGTHIMPFGVAPYYFIYGHFYVAQAIELIGNEALRDSQRNRFRAVMAKIREPNGGWNDRVFPRSRNFGTAMGMMALQMPELPRPRIWVAPQPKK